jgi:cytosine deaminase
VKDEAGDGRLALLGARLPDGRVADVQFAEGRIAAIAAVGQKLVGEGGALRESTGAIDLAGRLLCPAFVDGHIHLDKTLIGRPWCPHRPGDSISKRIAAEKALLSDLAGPPAAGAAKLIEQVVAHGTTRLRCHVDVDAQIGLEGLHALLDVRDRHRGLVDIELVAFPQSGVMRQPGVTDLLEAAIGEGADLVGGLDPAGVDGDVTGQLDTIFAIADRRGVGIDIHLHDPGALGAFELRAIASRAAALGMQGRVAVSHAFALGMIDAAELAETAEALARGGVAIMTSGPGHDAMPPVNELVSRGVLVFAGSDNIRDAWSPYGNGDMLERAMLIGYRSGFATDEDLALAFALATTHAAHALGVADHAVAVGARADLVVLDAVGIPEAVVARPQRRLVIKAGRPVRGLPAGAIEAPVTAWPT